MTNDQYWLELIMEKYLAYINKVGSLFDLAFAVDSAPANTVGIPDEIVQLVGGSI